jgi:hypothetical protein
MASLPRPVLNEVLRRQTKPGQQFATCPYTDKQFEDHAKWERGNAAHIAPHAMWVGLGSGSNCEFFANPNNIIFVDQLIHFNLEAYNTIPSFSLLHLVEARPPAGFPNDVVYQIVFSRRLRPDHPLRSAIKGSTVHLHKGTLPFVAIHFKYFQLVDPHPTGDAILTSCVTDLCVNFMARSQLEKNLPAAASAVFWPNENQTRVGKHLAPTQHQVFHAKAMVSKTVNLVSTLFKHTRGEKPPHYLAQVVNYTQASDKFGVIFFKEYSEEVLRDFIGSYSGQVKKVKKGSKRAHGEPKIFEYSAADFWKAFRGYADHAGYPMKSASSKQMSFLQQLPSLGYMLVSSNHSGVQQHGCGSDSTHAQVSTAFSDSALAPRAPDS